MPHGNTRWCLWFCCDVLVRCPTLVILQLITEEAITYHSHPFLPSYSSVYFAHQLLPVWSCRQWNRVSLFLLLCPLYSWALGSHWVDWRRKAMRGLIRHCNEVSPFTLLCMNSITDRFWFGTAVLVEEEKHKLLLYIRFYCSSVNWCNWAHNTEQQNTNMSQSPGTSCKLVFLLFYQG